MNRLQPILQKLGASQEAFLRAADGVSNADWLVPPSADRWSAGEVVGHLCRVEREIVAYADRVIRKAPRRVSFWRRWHLPIQLVESRMVKRKAPGAVEPVSLAEKETMLAELRGVRERTLAFLEETHSRKLEGYIWRHPFLGSLNFYDWFTFVAAHQVRHTKQLLELRREERVVATGRKIYQKM